MQRHRRSRSVAGFGGVLLLTATALVACSLLAPSDAELMNTGQAIQTGGGSGAGQSGQSGQSGSDDGGGVAGSGGTGGTAGDAAAPIDLCSNGDQDLGETGQDCGGTVCSARCGPTQGCQAKSDCLTQLVCVAGACVEPTCVDGAQNGTETDLDCGGSDASCARCDEGEACLTGPDCESQICSATVCARPECWDEVSNGSETDVDCGGSCPDCLDGEDCKADTDCVSMACAPDAPALGSGETCADAGTPTCLCEHCASYVTACVTTAGCRFVFSCFLIQNCGSYAECSTAQYCASTIGAFGGSTSPDVQAAADLFECAVQPGHCPMTCQQLPD